jgi:hypothetical protein
VEPTWDGDRPVAAVASKAKKITTATFDGAYFDGIAKILSEQFAPVVESFEGRILPIDCRHRKNR